MSFPEMIQSIGPDLWFPLFPRDEIRWDIPAFRGPAHIFRGSTNLSTAGGISPMSGLGTTRLAHAAVVAWVTEDQRGTNVCFII